MVKQLAGNPGELRTDGADAGQFSVIVPFGSPVEDWTALLARFAPLRPAMRELIIVHDGFQQAPPETAPPYLKVVATTVRGGPAGARNLGAEQARGDILAFTDDSCTPDPGWLDVIAAAMGTDIDAVVGSMRIPPADWLGDAISMLGFPGGGNLGFDKLWPVRPDGTTDHLSGCNVAVRAAAYRRTGGFDATFPFPGGEDNDLALRLRQLGSTIVFAPGAVVSHPARTGYGQLIRWQFRRGRGQFYLVRRFGGGGFLFRRIRSAGHVIGATWRRRYGVVMPVLIATCMLAQACGYAYERTGANSKARRHVTAPGHGGT